MADSWVFEPGVRAEPRWKRQASRQAWGKLGCSQGSEVREESDSCEDGGRTRGSSGRETKHL